MSTVSNRGKWLYVTILPCRDCFKEIIVAGIKRVVYIHTYQRYEEGGAKDDREAQWVMREAQALAERSEERDSKGPFFRIEQYQGTFAREIEKVARRLTRAMPSPDKLEEMHERLARLNE